MLNSLLSFIFGGPASPARDWREGAAKVQRDLNLPQDSVVLTAKESSLQEVASGLELAPGSSGYPRIPQEQLLTREVTFRSGTRLVYDAEKWATTISLAGASAPLVLAGTRLAVSESGVEISNNSISQTIHNDGSFLIEDRQHGARSPGDLHFGHRLPSHDNEYRVSTDGSATAKRYSYEGPDGDERMDSSTYSYEWNLKQDETTAEYQGGVLKTGGLQVRPFVPLEAIVG